MDAFYLHLHFLSSILPFPICQEIVICFCFSTLFLAMLFPPSGSPSEEM